MPFGGDFRLGQELQKFGDAFIGGVVFALHHPQTGAADNGVLRRSGHGFVIRHHADAVVEFGVLTNVRQRTGRGGGDGAVAVVELLGRLILTAKVGEVSFLVHLLQHGDMTRLLRLVENQLRIRPAEAVVFRRDRQAVPGAEVFNLDPALPAAGVAAFHTRFTQRRGILLKLLPGFRRLLRIEPRFFEGVFVVVEHWRGAVERLRQQMTAFRIGIIASDRRHKLRFIELDARIVKHFIDRLNGARRHHGSGAHFIHLQYRRRFAGAHCCDARRQALLIVAFVNRYDFVIRVRLVKTLCQ